MGVGPDEPSLAVEHEHTARCNPREPPQACFEQAVPQFQLPPQQPFFDAAGRGHRERKRVAVERPPESGDIQYGEDVAMRRVAHHRGGTGPGLDASAEMLRGVDLHHAIRPLISKCRSRRSDQ